jgi:hypothetical protein
VSCHSLVGSLKKDFFFFLVRAFTHAMELVKVQLSLKARELTHWKVLGHDSDSEFFWVSNGKGVPIQ